MDPDATRVPSGPTYNCSGGGARQVVLVTSWHTSLAIIVAAALIAAGVYFG